MKNVDPNLIPKQLRVKTRVLWAVKIGDPDWKEQLITDNPAQIERAKQWAMLNGFDRFRIAEIDLTDKPDFTQTLNK